jgi:hypothetical protein
MRYVDEKGHVTEVEGATHAFTIKLTQTQADYVQDQPEENSTWIREAVQQRITREQNQDL